MFSSTEHENTDFFLIFSTPSPRNKMYRGSSPIDVLMPCVRVIRVRAFNYFEQISVHLGTNNARVRVET